MTTHSSKNPDGQPLRKRLKTEVIGELVVPMHTDPDESADLTPQSTFEEDLAVRPLANALSSSEVPEVESQPDHFLNDKLETTVPTPRARKEPGVAPPTQKKQQKRDAGQTQAIGSVESFKATAKAGADDAPMTPKSFSTVYKRKTKKKSAKEKKKAKSPFAHGSGHVCDRCGKEFNNGHALGGHKKYCGKPEFKKSPKGSTSSKKSQRKRKRKRLPTKVQNKPPSVKVPPKDNADHLDDLFRGHYGNDRTRRGRHNLIGDEEKRWAFLNKGSRFISGDVKKSKLLATRAQLAQARAYSALLQGLSRWAAETVLLTESEQMLILQLEQEVFAGASIGDAYRMDRIRELLANTHGRIASIVDKIQRQIASEGKDKGTDGYDHEKYDDTLEHQYYVTEIMDDESRLRDVTRRFFDQNTEGANDGVSDVYDLLLSDMYSGSNSFELASRPPHMMTSMNQPPMLFSRHTTPVLGSAVETDFGMSKQAVRSNKAEALARKSSTFSAHYPDMNSVLSVEPVDYTAVPVVCGALNIEDTKTPMQGPRSENDDTGRAIAALPVLPPCVEPLEASSIASVGPPMLSRTTSLVSSYFR